MLRPSRDKSLMRMRWVVGKPPPNPMSYIQIFILTHLELILRILGLVVQWVWPGNVLEDAWKVVEGVQREDVGQDGVLLAQYTE